MTVFEKPKLMNPWMEEKKVAKKIAECHVCGEEIIHFHGTVRHSNGTWVHHDCMKEEETESD